MRTHHFEKKGEEAMQMPRMSEKGMRTTFITAGVLGAVAELGAGAWVIYNSEQMRMLRATRRAGRLMNRVGVALQTLSTVVEA